MRNDFFQRAPNKNHMTPQAELLNYKGMKSLVYIWREHCSHNTDRFTAPSPNPALRCTAIRPDIRRLDGRPLSRREGAVQPPFFSFLLSSLVTDRTQAPGIPTVKSSIQSASVVGIFNMDRALLKHKQCLWESVPCPSTVM